MDSESNLIRWLQKDGASIAFSLALAALLYHLTPENWRGRLGLGDIDRVLSPTFGLIFYLGVALGLVGALRNRWSTITRSLSALCYRIKLRFVIPRMNTDAQSILLALLEVNQGYGEFYGLNNNSGFDDLFAFGFVESDLAGDKWMSLRLSAFFLQGIDKRRSWLKALISRNTSSETGRELLRASEKYARSLTNGRSFRTWNTVRS